MKSILFCSLICLFLTSKGQTGAKVLKFPEVGWNIQIPDSNTSLDHRQLDSLMKVTNDKIENAGGQRLSFEGAKIFFTFLDKDYDSFGGAISSYDSTRFPSWMVFHNSTKRNLMSIIESQRPRLQILDTVSSVEIIDGLAFQLFYLKTYYQDKEITLQTYSYSRLQHGVDLEISIGFTREEVGKQYLDIFRHSKFDKD